MWELGENSHCGAMGTVGREAILSGAEGVFLKNQARRLGCTITVNGVTEF